MKVGLFGGSFDPIHCGHLQPVLEAVETLRLDRVVYLPTGRPPHKPDRRMAPALARYAMTELALLDYERLQVSGQELSETAPSYTIDTLLHFRSVAPSDDLYLLVGSDSFAELQSWHRWKEIVDLVEIAVLSRPGVGADVSQSGTPAHLANGVSTRVRFVANRPLDVSSTEVRRRLARGERPPHDWVPEPVVDFALKYRLYR